MAVAYCTFRKDFLKIKMSPFAPSIWTDISLFVYQMSNSRTVTASSTRRTSTTCWPPSARTRPMNIWWVDGSGCLISSNRSCPLSLSIQKVFSRLVSSHERRLPQSRMKPSPWILSKRTISFRLPILNPSRGWSVAFFPLGGVGRVPSRWFQERT